MVRLVLRSVALERRLYYAVDDLDDVHYSVCYSFRVNIRVCGGRGVFVGGSSAVVGNSTSFIVSSRSPGISVGGSTFLLFYLHREKRLIIFSMHIIIVCRNLWS